MCPASELPAASPLAAPHTCLYLLYVLKAQNWRLQSGDEIDFFLQFTSSDIGSFIFEFYGIKQLAHGSIIRTNDY